MDMILSKMKLYKGMKSLFLKTINPEMRIELFINLFPSFQLKELPTVDTVTLDMKEVKSNSADDEEFDSMADEYLDRIEKAKIPTHVVDRLLEEVENFDDDYGTGDAAKSKKFIDFCLSLP
ncbi:hypothetical protein FACS1894166_11490 [Bacilli bacterium]|nr:hypothetical protein FACS1894166_11490 [Bacilli bacterium]